MLRRMPSGPRVVGKYAAKTVYGTNTRIPLVREGTLLRPAMVAAMQRQGVAWVWVTDEIMPDLQIQEVVKQETVEIARQALADTFTVVQTEKAPTDRQLERLERSIHAVVEEIVKNKDVVSNIGYLREWDNYTFDHSIQVSILSTLIGKHLDMTLDQLNRLGIGAVLHDIGKLVVSQEILQKPGRLTDEEYGIVMEHPKAGWDLLHSGFSSIMPTSSIVALQHHERLDGSGYPSGLKGDAIYIFSRIVAVADVFDALRAERNYRPIHSPRQVMQIVRNEMGPKLDARAVLALLDHVAVVPQGEIVRLTNGLLGVVVGLNAGYPLQPVVEVVADDEDMPVAREVFDLKKSPVQVDQLLTEWPERFEERRDNKAMEVS